MNQNKSHCNTQQLSTNGTQDMPMQISSVESEIDPRTGLGTDHVHLDDSEYSKVSVKRVSDDTMKIIAVEECGFEWDYTLEIKEKAAQVLEYNKPRRELEDDIQDALLEVGYCVMGDL